jgi:F-type H+-transporting ATPase subunit b
MQLDWITVAAQIINFVILVWLLHRFLYGPITRAMERREERIKSRLDAAAKERAKAEARQRDLDAAFAELEAVRRDKLKVAEEDAHALRQKLEHEARDDVARKREAWLAELNEDREEFTKRLREEVGHGFRELAEDALRTLADTSLTERMADVLAARLDALSQDDIAELAGEARRAGVILVESGRDLDAGVRRRLTRAIHDAIKVEADVAYEVDREGLVGVRVKAGSASVEWSIDEYLDHFTETLGHVFPGRIGSSGGPRGGDEAGQNARGRTQASAEPGHG